ncbi:MAG: hypothetical protein H0U16_05780 [Actinobacteria bacterium]|nr:hypothetical protein [Actinomycetota bacterium]
MSTLGQLIQFERTLLGSEYFPFSDFDDTVSVMNAGRVDVSRLLTHRFPLEQIQDAFELFLSGESGKVLVGA